MDPTLPPHHPEPLSEPVTAEPAAQQPTMDESFSKLDNYADQLRVKLPLPPTGILNLYMNVIPWLAIIFGVLGGLISIVAVVGSTILGPLAVMFGASGSGFGLLLGSIVALGISVLEVVGGLLMLKRRATGWWLLAVGVVVSLLSSLVHLSVFGLLIGLLIAYIHLEVKPNYQ